MFNEAQIFEEQEKMSTGRVCLSQDFVLKASLSEAILLRIKNGERFELDPEQAELVSLCDGLRSVEEIVEQYCAEDCPTVLEFLGNLEEVGALLENHDGSFSRVFHPAVPHNRLQAVHLEATSRCNLSCAHCYQADTYPVSDNLTLDDVRGLIFQMSRMQVENVSLSGGEPFLDENWFEIAKLIEENDMRVSAFFTNGTVLTERKVGQLRQLQSNPTIFVSLDAITSMGMSFRGVPIVSGQKTINKILSSIKLLVRNGFNVILNTVLHRGNIGTLDEMYELIQSLGVRSWRIGFPKDTGYFKEKKSEFAVDWAIMAQAAFKLLQKHFQRGRPFHLQIEYLYREELLKNMELLEESSFVCDYEGRREGCCVKPNGDVVSCAYCTEFPIGNIRRQTLRNVWYSRKMRHVKDLRISDVEECRDCNLKRYCGTGCRVNAHFLHGDFSNAKDDYACYAVRFFRDTVIPFLRHEGAFS